MGILGDVSITATDLDENMLKKAQSAVIPGKNMQLNESNYVTFGGKATMLHENYYAQQNGHAVFNRSLLRRVSFRRHDLVLGRLFDHFDLILCRNVMIYFNESLQNEVLKKFHQSLYLDGYLAIGSRESLIWCDYANRFTVASNEEKIYKKII
jgi:chemotaxis protein methyltransferase CheR